MVDSYMITGAIISIIYFLIKFIEMRFIDKESKPLKEIMKNTTYVLFSSIIGGFLIEQFKFNNLFEKVKEVPKVFTNDPGF
jgi:hypothetical protein